MELGYDAVLLNTAVAKAGDPVRDGRAFAPRRRGRPRGLLADPMEPRDMAAPSTPVIGRAFLDLIRMLDRFYPIFDSAAWLERLLPLGVRLVQLRVKDPPEPELRARDPRARDLCAAAGAQLIVNDHWQLAIDEGCDFVHLGQEDLDSADLPAIRRAGLRLGVSTHDEAELDRALALAPDYVALGPVYPTILKAMKWAPQGLDRWPSGSGGSARSRWSRSAA